MDKPSFKGLEGSLPGPEKVCWVFDVGLEKVEDQQFTGSQIQGQKGQESPSQGILSESWAEMDSQSPPESYCSPESHSSRLSKHMI